MYCTQRRRPHKGCRLFEDCEEFEDLSAADLRKILKQSKLSSLDKQIAVCRIKFRMFYPDISAAVDRDRKTVSDHFKFIVVPEIRRIRANLPKCVGL